MATATLPTVVRAMRPIGQREATAYMRACRSRLSTTSTTLRATRQLRPVSKVPAIRGFHTTPNLRATVVAQNPRTDEDGKEMAIIISERAAKRLKHITSSQPAKNTLAPSSSTPSDSHLRVAVTSGGCHGFQYLMSLEGSDKIDGEEDTIFVFEDDTSAGGTAKVVLDESSLELLKGSTVDFTTELIGSQFKIVGNPRATSSCGCGTSFDIE